MRKHIVHWIIALNAILFFFSQCFGAEVKYSQELYKQLAQHKNVVPHLEIPSYTKIVLANGLTVYLAEAHELPIIMLKGRIDWGRSFESSNIAGISGFMVDLMNSGKTKHFEDGEMAKYKERYGLSFNLRADDEAFNFNGNALTSRQDQLISLAAEMLQWPRFDTKDIQYKKAQFRKSWLQAKTREDSLVEQYFYRNIMKNHPYSFNNDLELELAALNNITPMVLEDYYNRAFVPNNTILFVYGDFKTDAMQEMIKKYLSGWLKKELAASPVKVTENPTTYGKIILVDKPDATHAKIKMGYSFFDQDYFKDKLQDQATLDIIRRLIGGGMESVLMNEIRANKGYVYDISSQFYYLPLGGTFLISTSVKPDKACETVETVKKIMSDLKTGKQKVVENEIYKEIDRFNTLLPESLRDDDELIWDVIINTELKRKDKSDLNRYIQCYNNVTADRVQQAFAKYFFPERLFTVIVGKKETLLPQFNKAGIAVDVVINY